MFRSRFRAGAVALGVVLVVATSFLACTSTEGGRCNISLSHDECASGLTCVMPDNCHYAVCCPSNGRASSSSACNACPAEDTSTSDGTDTDAGTDSGTDDAAPDASDDADAGNGS